MYCQKWDSNPRLHSETRKPASQEGLNLESGALDRSAILTYVTHCTETFLSISQ